jgi:AcrR family transcriptional regulator
MAARDDLLDAADRAIRRLGQAASMAEIATEAGLTKPVLYRHFGDRDGLVNALASRHIDRLLPDLRAALVTPGDVMERLMATVEAFFAIVEEDPEIYRFLSSGEFARPDSPVSTFTTRFTAELADGLRVVPGFAPDDPRPDVWAPALVAMVRAAAEAWLAGAAQQGRTSHEVAALLGELLAGGLLSRPAAALVRRSVPARG